MPRIRYECTLSPEALAHPTAFAPMPVSTNSAWSIAQAQGWTVHGYPGTLGIDAPRSDVGPSARSAGDRSLTAGWAGGSRYAPPVWFPNLYFAVQRMWGGIGGVRIYSDNQFPIPTVPAADPRWVVPLTKPRQRWLLGRQLGQGPVFPRFPQWTARGRERWPGN